MVFPFFLKPAKLYQNSPHLYTRCIPEIQGKDSMSRSKKTFNFTKKSIDILPLPNSGKRDYYYDSKVQGLELVVTSSGAKSFKIYRRLLSSPVRISVGVYPQITVEEARKKGQQIISELLEGRNPNEEKKKMRRQATFGEMFSVYMERYSKIHKRSWKYDEREVIAF